MANATMAQMRAALANVLLAHYSSEGWNVSAYLLAKPEPPQMDIASGPILYDTAQARGNDDVRFFVRAVVAQGLDVAAQENLDALLDTTSADAFKTVAEYDRTLGGTISALRVSEASELKIYPVAGSDLVGVEFTVEITP